MSSKSNSKSQELAAVIDSNNRSWKSIAVSTLVIIFISAIIACIILVLSPEFGRHSSSGKNEIITLSEWLSGDFLPKKFNGSLISTQEIIFQDQFDNLIYLHNDSIQSPVILIQNTTFHTLHVDSYSLSPNREYLLIFQEVTKKYTHSFNAKYKIYHIKSEDVVPLTPDPLMPETVLQYATWGPTNAQLVFVYKNNIYYKKNVNDASIQVTKTEPGSFVFNGITDWLYEEEILSSNNAIWWAPDGFKFCFASFNDNQVGTYSYQVYEDKLNPITLNLKYPKAGTENPTVQLFVVNVKDDINIKSVQIPNEISSIEHYLYLVTWKKHDTINLIYTNRYQNITYILFCNEQINFWDCQIDVKLSTNGKGWAQITDKVLFDLSSNDYFFRAPSLQSQQDGEYIHILRVSSNKTHKDFLTKGRLTVTDLLTYDSNLKTLYYISNLEHKASERHIFAVNVKTKETRCISCEIDPNCLHNKAIFSENAKSFIYECLGPGIPRTEWRVVKDNQLVLTLQTNEDIRQKMSTKILPRVKKLTYLLSSGYNASIKLYLPPNLCENEVSTYPLLINVYGGPESQRVKENFMIDWGYYLSVKRNLVYGIIDGRGSGFNGNKMLFEVYRRLGTVEIQDQIEVTKFLINTFQWIDKSKVGIWGWSYGGYATTMVLASEFKNPVFSCGVAVAPVINWLYYDTAYTERYMGMPTLEDNLQNYQKNSPLNNVTNFKDKSYLILHGIADDNVHFQQSMKFMKLLQQNSILFDTQLYVDQNHRLPNVQRHVYKTIEAFLEKCFGLKPTRYNNVLKSKKVIKS